MFACQKESRIHTHTHTKQRKRHGNLIYIKMSIMYANIRYTMALYSSFNEYKKEMSKYTCQIEANASCICTAQVNR